MKKLNSFVTAIILCISIGAFAQNRLDENFEKIDFQKFPPYGWTNIDHDGDGSTWELSAKGDGENEGTGAVSWSWNMTELLPDNWLITPQLIVKASDSLKFWMSSFDTYPESYEVWVSTKGKEVSDFTDKIDDFVFSEETNKVNRSISLKEYAGKKIYIAFRHNTPASHLSIRLDNVKGPEIAPFTQDISLTKMINHQEHGCDVNKTNPSVLIENLGTEDYSNFSVHCRMISTVIKDFELVPDYFSPIITKTYTGTINAGEKDTLTFDDILPYDEYTGTIITLVWLTAPDDQFSGNDSLTLESNFQSSLELPLSSGFETGETGGKNEWENWVSVNTSDKDVASAGWGSGTNPPYVRTGSAAAVFNVDAWGDDSYVPYDGTKHYLATPCLYFEEGKEYQIQLNAIFNYGKKINFKFIYGRDQHHLLEENTLISTAEFTNDGSYQTIGSEKFSVQKSGAYYVGIMAYVDTPISEATKDSAFLIFVDDFLIRDVSTPAPIDLAIVSISAPFDCNLSSAEEISVTVANASLEPVSAYTLTYTVNKGTPVSVDITEALAAKEKKTYTFETPADFSEFGQYNISASISYSGDDILKNNNSQTITTKNVSPLPLLSDSFEEYFEHEDLTEEWLSLNYGKNTWQVSEDFEPDDEFEFAYTGVAFLSHSAWRTDADEWLISRCIKVEKDSSYIVSFAYRGDNGGAKQKAKLGVFLLSSYDHNSVLAEVYKNEDIKNNEYAVHKYEYKASEDGIVHIGLHAYSGYDIMDEIPATIILDDISFKSKYHVSIEDQALANSFRAYPNPVKDKLYLEAGQDIKNISIYSILGTKVMEKQISHSTTKTSLSTEGLTDGIYMVQIQTGNQIITQKIVIN